MSNIDNVCLLYRRAIRLYNNYSSGLDKNDPLLDKKLDYVKHCLCLDQKHRLYMDALDKEWRS